VVFEEAVNHVKRGTRAFGVSVDLDAFDPEVAPGIGSPEPNGLTLKEVKSAFRLLSHDNAFVGLEIAEYNPERDIKHKTAKLIKTLIVGLLTDGGNV
jgi:arginase